MIPASSAASGIEIGARRLRKPTNGEGSPLAKIYPVAVKVENLLLAELLFHLLRNQHLGQLPPNGFLRSEEETARKLHGQGRPALLMPFMPKINPCGFGHAYEIHAPVLEEAPVFYGKYSIDH